ncbi:MAG: metal ABC transporter permease [Dehalococcoidia bacterium]|nr:metal ABC transporter permease [Chloroflexota bacterium]
MFDLLTEPLEFAFMQRAFLAASLAAVVCAAVGTFVVLKGLAFMGDAVAHSSLAGMALVYALGGSILLGALAWVVPASLVITYVSRRANVMLDTSIGIIYAGGFALGIIILSQVSNYTVDLFGFLFGNVLGATWGDIIIIGAVAAAVLLVMAILYKELIFTSYDSTMAEVSGVPVRLVQYLMPLLIGVTTVVALKTVGIVLVLALLVTPAATARLLVRRLPLMMATSVLVALAATVVGLYLSFHLDLASGPTIVLVATGIFALALVVSPSRGVVWRRRSREAISTSVGA